MILDMISVLTNLLIHLWAVVEQKKLVGHRECRSNLDYLYLGVYDPSWKRDMGVYSESSSGAKTSSHVEGR